MRNLRAFVVTLIAGLFFGCVSDPSLRDPTDPGVAEISGSVARDPAGVAISISAIDDEPRVIGAGPLWKRRVAPGPHRVTVYVVSMILGGKSEFSFEALRNRRYEIRARDGGGFYFVDLVDITDPSRPEVALRGRFAASGSILYDSPFVILPLQAN